MAWSVKSVNTWTPYKAWSPSRPLESAYTFQCYHNNNAYLDNNVSSFIEEVGLSRTVFHLKYPKGTRMSRPPLGLVRLLILHVYWSVLGGIGMDFDLLWI
jgi:hypothetical protein